jgi:hypothetical protein
MALVGLVLIASGCQKNVTVYVRNRSDKPIRLSLEELGKAQVRDLGTAGPGGQVEFSFTVPYDELPSTYEINWVTDGPLGELKRATAITILQSTRPPLRVELPAGTVQEAGD